MVASHVGIQLLLSDFFYKLGEGGDNGNRAVVANAKCQSARLNSLSPRRNLNLQRKNALYK